MDKLEAWLKPQFDERLVEPNSGLGKALSYPINHWPRLTLFLGRAGAPLDNNLAERSLKKAILHRKNSLFYKTRNGARMGDLYMSLIHTCELNGVNPFPPDRRTGKPARDYWKRLAAGKSTSCWCGGWTAGAGRLRICWRLSRNWNISASGSFR